MHVWLYAGFRGCCYSGKMDGDSHAMKCIELAPETSPGNGTELSEKVKVCVFLYRTLLTFAE